jgi:hypothetical protein
VLSKNVLKRQILLSQLCWHKELNYHIQQTKNNLLKRKKQTRDINQNPWEKKIKQT